MGYITTVKTGNTLRNQKGTAERSCGCGSWLDHWKRYTKSTGTPLCVVQNCNERATVGAHVELSRVDELKGQSYIAPMCASHNGQHGAELKSKPEVKLARGNVKETCGKA